LSLPILPFLFINPIPFFWTLKLTFITWYFYRFFVPPFSTGHPPSLLHMPSSPTLAEITFHSVTSFIVFHHHQPFLFNNHPHAIDKPCHSMENTMLYSLFTSSPVSCMPRVMSHSPAIMAAPVKEWLLSYLVA
jgi:hypothetical protein